MRELISGVSIEKYKYDTREERDEHVADMEADGWECTGTVMQSDTFDSAPYFYGEFYKYG